MFQIGDSVFYPGFGAGVILSIEDKEIEGKINKYYVINLIISQMNVMIPVYSKESEKIRSTVPRHQVLAILEILKQQPKDFSPKWIDRYKVYYESLNKGDISIFANILRDAAGISKKRVLSKSDLKYLKEILNQISSEISIVLGIQIIEAKNIIISSIGLPV